MLLYEDHFFPKNHSGYQPSPFGKVCDFLQSDVFSMVAGVVEAGTGMPLGGVVGSPPA